jgi:hypothetical protein
MGVGDPPSENASRRPRAQPRFGPFELDFFVRLCIGDSVTAEAEFDTGAGFNMLMLQPEYMRRLGLLPDTKPRGALEYYVYSTFLPELHYCAAPAVRTEKQFVGFKDLHLGFTQRARSELRVEPHAPVPLLLERHQRRSRCE